MSFRRTKFLTPVAWLLFAACAAGVGAGETSGEEAFLVVENNLLPQRPVTIRAVASTGASKLLGVISPGSTRTLRYREQTFRGSYFFVAEIDGEGTIVSTSRTLDAGTRLAWSLRNNTLRDGG